MPVGRPRHRLREELGDLCQDVGLFEWGKRRA